jgi:hypothetical protein
MEDLAFTFPKLKNLRRLILKGSIKSLATLNMLLKYLPELKPLRILDISENSFKEETTMIGAIAQNSLISSILPSVTEFYESEAFKAVDLLAQLIKKLGLYGLGLANCELGDRELDRLCQTLLSEENDKPVKLVELDLSSNPFSVKGLYKNMNNLLMNFRSVKGIRVSVKDAKSKKKIMKLKDAYSGRNLFIDIREVK